MGGAIKLVACPSGTVLGMLVGHQGMVSSVCLFDDRRTLASAGSDATVRVWDVAGRAELFVLRGHAGEVHAVRPCAGATATQGTLVSVSQDRSVAVWDVATRALTRRWEASQQKLTKLSVAHDGRSLVVGGDDCAPAVWDLETMEKRFTLLSHTARVTVAEHSRDGRTCATGGADRTLRVWRTHAAGSEREGAWTEHCGLVGLADALSAVAFSPDGSLVAAGSFGAVIAWDVASGAARLSVVMAGERAWVRKVWFARGGKRVVAQGDAGQRWAWDVASGAECAPGGEERGEEAEEEDAATRDIGRRVFDPRAGLQRGNSAPPETRGEGGYEVTAEENTVLVFRTRAGGGCEPGAGPVACYHANVQVSVVRRRGACLVVGKADGEVMHLYAPFLESPPAPPKMHAQPRAGSQRTLR
ncbi:WD40-repeat-containing domain protein [Baffinella frigidus]|nr:WD40-repeat-containing domain protein [Cryptophyta sp. CCMP2293]